MFKNIKDKRVLITGASGGIGSCMVLLFADYQAKVGIHHHNGKKEAENLVRQVEKKMGVQYLFKLTSLKILPIL